MRKFLIIASFFLLVPVISSAKSVCFYYADETGRYEDICHDACELISQFDDNCVVLPITQFFMSHIFGGYYITYIASHGNDKGVYEIQGEEYMITWEQLAGARTEYLIVDTCYSGYIYDVPRSKVKATYIITATGKCLSVTRSFVEALKCWLNYGECMNKNIPYCHPRSFDFGLCQMELSFEIIGEKPVGLFLLEDHKNLPVCIGTAKYKGPGIIIPKPFRW